MFGGRAVRDPSDVALRGFEYDYLGRRRGTEVMKAPRWLLYDTEPIFEDQFESVEDTSRLLAELDRNECILRMANSEKVARSPWRLGADVLRPNCVSRRTLSNYRFSQERLQRGIEPIFSGGWRAQPRRSAGRYLGALT